MLQCPMTSSKLVKVLKEQNQVQFAFLLLPIYIGI